MYQVILYTTESGRSPVQEFLNKLIKDGNRKELSKIIAYKERLEECGMQADLTYPETTKHLQGDIYELRPGRNRVLFFAYHEGCFILLHAFKKKTDRTPKKEIEQAIREMKDYKERS